MLLLLLLSQFFVWLKTCKIWASYGGHYSLVLNHLKVPNFIQKRIFVNFGLVIYNSKVLPIKKKKSSGVVGLADFKMLVCGDKGDSGNYDLTYVLILVVYLFLHLK